MLNSVDYDQLRASARNGTGTKVQMFTGSAPAAGNLASFDASANVGAVSIASTQTPWVTDQNAAGYKLGSVGAIGIGVAANATYPLLVSGGNVGIGTSTPGCQMEVQANALLSSRWLSASGAQALYNILTNNANGSQSFWGLEGSSGAQLAGNSSANAAVLGTGYAFSVQLVTNNNVRMTITSSGNVGIGTTSPQAALHVAGAVIMGVPNSAPVDANIGTSQVSIWVNESTNALTFRVKYSTGTLKTGTVSLA